MTRGVCYCEKCERIKDEDEDCMYLGCNPKLYQREMSAGELYTLLRADRAEVTRLRADLERATEQSATVIAAWGNFWQDDGNNRKTYWGHWHDLDNAVAALPDTKKGAASDE